MPFVVPSPRPLPHSPWKQAPLLRYVVFVVLGISAAWLLRMQVSGVVWFILTILFAVASLCTAVFLKGNRFRQIACPVGAFTLIFASAALLQFSFRQVRQNWPHEPSVWVASVWNVHRQYESAISVDVKLHHANADYNGQTVRLRIGGDSARALRSGDRVAFHGVIAPPYHAGNPGDFDYRTYLLVHGIGGTAYVDDEWKLLPPASSPGPLARLWRYRQHLLQTYSQYFQDDELAILSALTLGDKSLVDSSLRQLFSDTGVNHVLALSGLHLGILFSFFNLLLLRRFRRGYAYWVSNILFITALWLFVFMVGAPISLLRSAWMFTLMQVGNCLQRTQTAALNNLSFAALVILIVSPMSLFDVGFQLSFAAVAGIILANAYLWQRLPIPVWDMSDPVLGNLDTARNKGISSWRVFRLRVWRMGNNLLYRYLMPFVAVSLSAQICTAPFVIYYFHVFSPYTLLSNFVVIPSAYLLLGGALLFFLVPLSLWQQVWAQIIHYVLFLMTGGLSAISQWPGAALHFYPHWITLVVLSLLTVSVFAFFMCPLRCRRPLIYVSALLVAVCVVCEGYRLRPGRVQRQLIVYNIPRTTAVHFLSSADTSYIYTSTGPDSLRLRLARVEQNYFAPVRIAYPQIIDTARVSRIYGRGLYACAPHFVFAGQSVYVLARNVRTWRSERPLPLHTLVVSRGCRDSLSVVLRHFSPRNIVLDSGMTPYYRKRWTAECRAARIPCHDVRSQGAYVQLIP